MSQGPREEGENGRPIIRDRRRIDPKTYQVRDPDAAAEAQNSEPTPADQATDQPGPSAELSAEVEKLKTEVADRTSDLQRVQAEYVNYKRRVDRDRDLARASGVEAVLRDLLGVLDSVQAAREHEELTGGFKAVAEEIEKLAARHGLEPFGEPGEAFDPRIHEALMHATAEGITGPTAVTILQSGYKIKDRVIRPARVAVAEPEPGDTGSVDHGPVETGSGNAGAEETSDAHESE